MVSAKSIINKLVENGLIPQEFSDVAAAELHRELSRRSRRTAQTLAALTSQYQLGLRVAKILC